MKRFGKYRLQQRIAVGGTAEVFRSVALWADGTEERVVLKKILPQHASNPSFRELFHEEALLLASLRHPNIVGLRDFGELKGTLYLALEHVEGADLDVLLERGLRTGEPPPPPVAAFVVAEVARALECIHSRTASDGTPLRIVHRDISPHNILVSDRGEVKLADFGIAKSAIRVGCTTEGTIKGKFDYLSPEQASPGDPVDARADLFALGAVLCEMLMGRPPFRGKTDVETLERVRGVRYELDESRLAPPHRPLLAVVRRCLQANPADRPKDATELVAELAAYQAALESAATREDLGSWVRQVRDAQSPAGSIDALVQDLFSPGRQGQTAVVSGSRRALTAETPAAAASPTSRRASTAALLVAVAVVTAAVTLVLSRYIGPSPAPPGPARSAARTDPPGADARVVATPPASMPATPGSGPDSRVTESASPDAGAPWLEVRSIPPGARVTVNDASAGATPTVLPAPRRRFRLRITRPGYRPWTRRLDAPDRDLRVEARLERRPRRKGRLTVNSIPWAHVYLDGHSIGTTPIRALAVPSGEHRVVLKDGRGRLLRSFVTTVRPGHTAVHSFDRRKGR